MILHLILNSLFVFIILSLFIEFLIFLFQIHNKRIKYICRLLPLIKIPFDILVFTFWGESFFINLNPLSCEIYVYELLSYFVSLPPIDWVIDQQLIVPQYLAKQLSNTWLNCLTAITLCIAGGGILGRMYQWYSTKKYLKEIFLSATPSTRYINNKILEGDLKRHDVQIFQSTEVKIPFAVCPRFIVTPSELIDFTDDEFAAIIAHELQHLKWKDPLLRSILSFFHSLFWWLPTQRWLNRVVKDQEEASDASMQKYGIENYCLASAIKKTLNNRKKQRNESDFSHQLLTNCLLGLSNKLLLKRIEILLSTPSPKSSPFYLKEGAQLIFSFLTFISLWMC